MSINRELPQKTPACSQQNLSAKDFGKCAEVPAGPRAFSVFLKKQNKNKQTSDTTFDSIKSYNPHIPQHHRSGVRGQG